MNPPRWHRMLYVACVTDALRLGRIPGEFSGIGNATFAQGISATTAAARSGASAIAFLNIVDHDCEHTDAPARGIQTLTWTS